MGYYTSYNLDIIGDTSLKLVQGVDAEGNPSSIYVESEIPDAYEILRKYSGSSDFHDIKWSDHEKDMIKASLDYPGLLFKLYGEGEESGDIWIKYFKNGKRQICYGRIIFDDFDETKLN